MGNTIIKYREGYIVHPLNGTIIPKPYQMWDKPARDSIFPLMLVFSIAWSFEMVTHLEELCFWLFLVNSGSAQQEWFSSVYFKAWAGGSAVAVIYMPLVTIFTRSNPLKARRGLHLLGGEFGKSLPHLVVRANSVDVPQLPEQPGVYNDQVTNRTFPSSSLQRREGVDLATIVRLTKFSELNTIRVVFRFLFTIPLLILGIDGCRPHNHINESALWTDFLVVLAGFGCSISSAITLVIFFPRSIEGEIAAADAKREKRLGGRSQDFKTAADPDLVHQESLQYSNYSHNRQQTTSTGGDTYLLTSSPVKNALNLDDFSTDGHHGQVQKSYTVPLSTDGTKAYNADNKTAPRALPATPIRPNRRRGEGIELGGPLTESNLSMHNLHYRRVNPMVSNFTSPIDFAYQTYAQNPGAIGTGTGDGSGQNFTRR